MSRNSLSGSRRSFDKNCASYKDFSMGPKKSSETNISKEAIFPGTQDFGLFFHVLSSVTNIREQFTRVDKPF